jgi:NAD(P)H-nitrite reductase large subunit
MSSDDLHPAIRALKVVCRCNNIKFRSIEKAINDGAKSISQVASRTTATTGHCGGSCTPDIQAMIDTIHGTNRASAVVTPDAGPADDADAWWLPKEKK